MINFFYIINIIIFFFSLLGLIFRRNSILIILIIFELMILSINMILILKTTQINFFEGYIFSLFILTISGVDSAIGLALLYNATQLQ